MSPNPKGKTKLLYQYVDTERLNTIQKSALISNKQKELLKYDKVGFPETKRKCHSKITEL